MSRTGSDGRAAIAGLTSIPHFYLLVTSTRRGWPPAGTRPRAVLQ